MALLPRTKDRKLGGKCSEEEERSMRHPEKGRGLSEPALAQLTIIKGC